MSRVLHLGAALLLVAGSALQGADAVPRDEVERAAAALEQGLRAEARADRPAERAAARALRSSGAMPIEGQPDVADHWERIGGGSHLSDRGRALGPGYRLLTLDAGAKAAFAQTFLAGQRARVAVAPAPAAIFALVVSEDGGAAPTCTISTARTRCDWVPPYTQRFRIELTNRGPRSSRFYMIVE